MTGPRLLALAALLAAPAAVEGTASPVAPAGLRVTAGAIAPGPGGTALITGPKVRAVLDAPGGDSAELRFRFLGATSDVAPLASGVVRRQLGLKLRAQDACNVLYVMWRLDPTSQLAISVKRNPGRSRSAECGPRGYHDLAAVALPPLEPGSRHALRADLRGGILEVRVDGDLAFRGAVDARLCPPSGPAGVRTDNVRMEFQLLAGGP